LGKPSINTAIIMETVSDAPMHGQRYAKHIASGGGCLKITG